jgi:hypothetical protein
MVLKETSSKSNSLEYAVLPSHAPELIVANTIYVRTPDKIESVVSAERTREFEGLVRRYVLSRGLQMVIWVADGWR